MSTQSPQSALNERDATVYDPASPAAPIVAIPGRGNVDADRRCDASQWRQWRSAIVRTIGEALSTARFEVDDPWDKRAIHATISPPQSETTRVSELMLAREEAVQRAIDHGLRGGVLVFHGFRLSETGQESYDSALNAGEWDPSEQGGEWWWVRSKGANWREFVEWSPHFHALGLSQDFEANNPDAEAGWVCQRIRSLERFEIDSEAGYRHAVCTAKHILTHATFLPGDSRPFPTTWFGTMANGQLAEEPATHLRQGVPDTIETNVAAFV